MIINGECPSCGRNFNYNEEEAKNLEGKPCPATDHCPSHFEEEGIAYEG